MYCEGEGVTTMTEKTVLSLYCFIRMCVHLSQGDRGLISLCNTVQELCIETEIML